MLSQKISQQSRRIVFYRAYLYETDLINIWQKRLTSFNRRCKPFLVLQMSAKIYYFAWTLIAFPSYLILKSKFTGVISPLTVLLLTMTMRKLRFFIIPLNEPLRSAIVNVFAVSFQWKVMVE